MQIGIVDGLEGPYARVRLSGHSSCSECGACSGKATFVLARNDAGAAPGDRVSLESSPAGILSVTLIIFVLPMLAIFAGIGAGLLAARALGVSSSPAAGIGAAVFFALSLLAAVAYDRRAKTRAAAAVKIVGILEE